jgi:hypothetical protein
MLASGGYDNTTRLWDVDSGKNLGILTAHSDRVTSVCFSPNGKTLASASYDSTIKLWNMDTGKVCLTLTSHTKPFTSIIFSPNGKTLCSGSLDKTIRLWDVATGRELRVFNGHSDGVTSVCFSPDGKTIASSSSDKTIRLWDMATGQELHTLVGHSNWVFGLDFSPDGRTLASGSMDKTIKLWDVATGKELHALSGHSGAVQSVVFSPDGNTLASASRDTTIKLWGGAAHLEIASLCTSSDGNWAVVTPEGRFDASNLDDIQSLAWVLPDAPMKALPVEVFLRQYYEPRLLVRSLSGEKFADVPPIASLNRVQPEVSITNVSPHPDVPDLVDVTMAYRSVSQINDGKSATSGVYDLRLFRDGQLVGYLPETDSFSASDPKDLTEDSTERSFTHTFTVPLQHNNAKQVTLRPMHSTRTRSRA